MQHSSARIWMCALFSRAAGHRNFAGQAFRTPIGPVWHQPSSRSAASPCCRWICSRSSPCCSSPPCWRNTPRQTNTASAGESGSAFSLFFLRSWVFMGNVFGDRLIVSKRCAWICSFSYRSIQLGPLLVPAICRMMCSVVMALHRGWVSHSFPRTIIAGKGRTLSFSQHGSSHTWRYQSCRPERSTLDNYRSPTTFSATFRLLLFFHFICCSCLSSGPKYILKIPALPFHV